MREVNLMDALAAMSDYEPVLQLNQPQCGCKALRSAGLMPDRIRFFE